MGVGIYAVGSLVLGVAGANMFTYRNERAKIIKMAVEDRADAADYVSAAEQYGYPFPLGVFSIGMRAACRNFRKGRFDNEIWEIRVEELKKICAEGLKLPNRYET